MFTNHYSNLELGNAVTEYAWGFSGIGSIKRRGLAQGGGLLVCHYFQDYPYPPHLRKKKHCHRMIYVKDRTGDASGTEP